MDVKPENQWRSVVNPLDPHQSPRPSAFGKEGASFCRLFRVGPSLSVELLGVTVGPAPLRSPPAASQFSAGSSQTTAPGRELPHVVCLKALEFCQSWRDESPYLSRPPAPPSLKLLSEQVWKSDPIPFWCQLRVTKILELRELLFHGPPCSFISPPLYRHSQTTS